jgi:hypothetical protein
MDEEKWRYMTGEGGVSFSLPLERDGMEHAARVVL